jgi:ABC-type uncharacterized transport system substrate-binding protein
MASRLSKFARPAVCYRLPVFLIALSVAFVCEADAQDNLLRRILILNEVGPTHPAVNIIDRGIREGLRGSPYHFEFYTEYLETTLFPDPQAQQNIRAFYLTKYKDRRPDVIITVGPSPLAFLSEIHQQSFSGVPVVFCLPSGEAPGAPTLGPNFTGVENDMAPAETVKVALRLQPGTKRLIVVGGSSAFDKKQISEVRKRLTPFETQLEISTLTDVTMPDMLASVKALPPETIVLFTSFNQDVSGARFVSGSEAGPMIAAAANAPVFSLYDVYLGHGEVGGYLSNLHEQGRIAVNMALRILDGTKPQEIPPAKSVFTYMFDWRALRRWGMNEGDLPPASTVLNREPTLWESYKPYVLAVTSLLVVESLLIAALLWQTPKKEARGRKNTHHIRAFS